MRKNFYLTHIAVLVTFAVVIHTVEAALPLPMPVPGVRLGLANIITLLALVFYGLQSGLAVAVLRTFLGSLVTGGFLGFGFWLSLAGGILSCLVMSAALVLVEKGWVTLLSVSVLGAATHNLVQLAVAGAIVANPALFTGYLPVMLLLAVPTGVFTGLAAFSLEGTTRRILRRTGSPAGPDSR